MIADGLSHEALALILAAGIAAGGTIAVATINKTIRNGKTTTLSAVDARISLVNEHLDAAIRRHEEDVADIERRLDVLERRGGSG